VLIGIIFLIYIFRRSIKWQEILGKARWQWSNAGQQSLMIGKLSEQNNFSSSIRGFIKDIVFWENSPAVLRVAYARSKHSGFLGVLKGREIVGAVSFIVDI
jgi:hypothetical protein